MTAGCSSEADKLMNTHLSGRLSVDETLDETQNYSGIELLISYSQSSDAEPDTVFHAVTDEDGYFSGTASFEEKNIYTLIVSRNRNTFGIIRLVLAGGDSVSLNAELPDVSATAEIVSGENDVYKTFQRVDRNFDRVARFINAGAISADSVEIELEKWSGIYWDIYEEYPGTFAAKLAGETTLSLLSNWNDSLLSVRQADLLETENTLTSGTRDVLMEYYTELEGLRAGLDFLDDLEAKAPDEDERMELQIERIELLYDSARTNQANTLLNDFRNTYSGNAAAIEWADNISYDLEMLSPGSPFPDFGFLAADGDSVSTVLLTGSPFLVEITRLDNVMYQQQYNRTVAIHQIYRNFGLKIITIPIENSEVTVDAFFGERGRLWTVARPNSFDSEELRNLLNINQTPTRFLVDDEGRIIRRYIGDEYDDIVRGLQRIITEQNP